MLQPEEEYKSDSRFDSPENDIGGPSVPAPIRGIIFDVGSTLFFATKQETLIAMNNAIKQTLSTHFKWNSQDIDLFWSHYSNIHREYNSKKVFIGSGTVFDEGWCHEPSIKSWIIEACKRMNKLNVNPDDTIYDEAITAFRTPRLHAAQTIPNITKVLSELRDKYGIKLAICSNDRCKTRVRSLLSKYKLLNYFDIVMISSEIGKRKPDIRLTTPILIKWKKDYNIQREHIVFIGDKKHTDVDTARRLGLRSIQCELYDRNDIKYKKHNEYSSPLQRTLGTYLGVHSDDILNKLTAFHDNYPIADAVLYDYLSFIPMLKELAQTKGSIIRSNFNVFKWKPIVIGVLLRPKKIDKFRKMRMFEVMDYRCDVIYRGIDMRLDIDKQGPFDIILHKLNWYHFNARFDDKINGYLQNALKYIKKIKHKTYISDDVRLGIECQDRWYVYNTIANANILVNYEDKKNVRILCPKSILITHKQIKEFGYNYILSEIERLNVTFPLYFKPRISGRTPTNKYDGHCLYIIPIIDNINMDLVNKLLLNENGDWIIQEYIDHKSGCHKVYNLGYFVFCSINGSTPCYTNIYTNNITIHSTGISSKRNEDQSKRDELAQKHQFYQNVSYQLKNAFKLNLFGFDIIFDSNSIGYCVDFNFMPSFKIVNNFHTVLTEYLLYQYYDFMKK